MYKFFRKLFLIPLLPIVIIVGIYISYMIRKYTNPIEIYILNVTKQPLLTQEIKDKIKEYIKKYKIIIFSYCIICWYFILRFISNF